jgi:hypothetical protein|tara:strand:- start:469 stop:1620 length:1152 start_codon:yes stop_codon:yes gene_type:complete
MDNINIQKNLFLKQFNESNAIAYNPKFVANPSDYNFRLLDNAYRLAGKHYAKIKIAIESNRCQSEHCSYELAQLKQLEEAPQKSTDFLTTLIAELNVTDENAFDPNNDFRYAVANSIMMARPGYSKNDGYEVYLDLLENGSQQIEFNGPAFVRMQPMLIGDEVIDIQVPYPLVINNVSLQSLINSDTSLIASTPDINSEMQALLPETGLFMQEMINENKELKATAKISEEFVIKNADGSFDYEIIDLGGGKGKNVLKFDMAKIEKKVTPFINAEVAGLMSSEQDVVAAWNVYISKDTSVSEDDQMAQNANAGNTSWSYELDLPLQQDKKVLFETKYKEYFMNNYLKQFTKNQTPTVKEDAAVFDLAEAKKAKAQKFLDDNNLN